MDNFQTLLDFLTTQPEGAEVAIPAAVALLVLGVAGSILAVRRRRALHRSGSVARGAGELPLTEEPTVRVALPPIPDEPVEAVTPEPPPGRTTAVAAEESKAPAGEAGVLREIQSDTQASWLKRLTAGLARTRQQFRSAMAAAFPGLRKIDDATLEQLHETLFRADFGVKTADSLVGAVRAELGTRESADWAAVEGVLKSKIAEILLSAAKPIQTPDSGPQVILIVGVNGVGKTTTIGKLAAHHRAAGKSVILCASDTFRAAAIDQLAIWGERTGSEIVRHQPGSDPAAVAFDAVKASIARKADVLLVDTAGRLHNKQDLMAELAKINRTIARDLPGAPHETWLVIDATTGQNAVQQVRAFREVVALTGLVVTKLDGTAKGGVVVGIAEQFGLPIQFVGVGEKAADLRPFSAKDFADSLFAEE